MADEPDVLSKRIVHLFEKRAARFSWTSKAIKALFIATGVAIAGIAQFVQAQAGPAWTVAQIVGIWATIIAFIGSLFVVLTEEDASEQLAAAHKAMEEARTAIAQIGAFENLIEQRAETEQQYSYLYLAATEMRRVLERSVINRLGLRRTLTLMLGPNRQSLSVAAGFLQSDTWTLCIYKAFEGDDGGRDYLVCVDQLRAVECNLSSARRWPEGVGVSGIAYAIRDDVIVPNMHTFGIGTLFNVGDNARPYDHERYRSAAAFPIKVDGREKPWGVVVATNDRHNHFSKDKGPGLQTTEAIRLIAGMVALAVAVSSGDDVLIPMPEEGGIPVPEAIQQD